MNIFYLSEYADEAAEFHCDKHVNKMIMETVQMMSTAHRELDGDEWADSVGLVKRTHVNHPSTKWVRSGVHNYVWMLELLTNLCQEKRKRWPNNAPHQYEKFIDILSVIPDNMPDEPFTAPPQCMTDDCKHFDTVIAYRKFYHKDKPFAEWKYTQAPVWWKGYLYDYS
jgi:hypothetical protein